MATRPAKRRKGADYSLPTMTHLKNKTTASSLALIGGQFGLHRLYLYGCKNVGLWLHTLPSCLGWWGMARVMRYGQDDQLAWVLVPLLGFSVAGGAVMAIYYALQSAEQWNARYNPQALSSPQGQTNWATIGVLVFSLLVGTIVLMSSIVFSFQRYFEFQIGH